jgi:hypothetical protein
MPLESLACSHCGSSEVKEVKANTYFCDHCDAVFKLVDPNSVTVTNNPSFCSCGETVAAKCQLCDATMCVACDAGGKIEAYSFSHGSNRPILVHTVGFGHLCYTPGWGGHPAPMVYGCFVVDGHVSDLEQSAPRTNREFHDGSRDLSELTVGPFLSSSTLQGFLKSVHSALRHVCWPCVVSAIPDVIELIANGTMCANPYCGNFSSTQCRCCRFGFCEGHIGLPAAGLASITAEVVSGVPTSHSAFPIHCEGVLCTQCIREVQSRIRDICEHEHPQLTSGYSVPITRKRNPQSRAQRAEDERAIESALQVALDVSRKLDELVDAHGCTLQDTFYGTEAYFIHDERATTTPGVGPGVLGAR